MNILNDTTTSKFHSHPATSGLRLLWQGSLCFEILKMTYEYEQLNTLLTALIADFNMSDVRQEINKIKREQVN